MGYVVNEIVSKLFSRKHVHKLPLQSLFTSIGVESFLKLKIAMLEIGNLTPVELSRTILQPVSSVVKKCYLKMITHWLNFRCTKLRDR